MPTKKKVYKPRQPSRFLEMKRAEPERWITAKTAADVAGVHKATIYSLLKRGELKKELRILQYHLVSEVEIRAYFQLHENAAAGAA